MAVTSAEKKSPLVERCLRIILRPIVRFALRNALTLPDLVRILKIVLVEVGQSEMSRSTDKINSSRLSIMTGVHRKDVTRIFRQREEPISKQASLLARVVGQWENDRRFSTRRGDPLILSCNGPGSDFWRLVESVSTNIAPATVLFELERAGAIERRKQGIRLVRLTNMLGKIPERALEVVSSAIEDQIKSALENLLDNPAVPNLHLRTSFDNIAPKDIGPIRQWILEHGRQFHKQVREHLAKYDRDMSPSESGDGRGQVTISSFSVTQESQW